MRHPVGITFLCTLFSTHYAKGASKNFPKINCFSDQNSFPYKRRFIDRLLNLIRKVEMFGWYF